MDNLCNFFLEGVLAFLYLSLLIPEKMWPFLVFQILHDIRTIISMKKGTPSFILRKSRTKKGLLV